MKYFSLTVLSLLLLNCSNPKSDSSVVTDSTATDSASVVEVSQLDEEEIPEDLPDEPEGDSVVNAIRSAIDDLSLSMAQESGTHVMSASYSGYESGSESSWYFDSALNLKYCNGNWDMEGTSGTYSYYFDGDDLVAYTSEDMYQEGGEVVQLHNTQNASAKDEFSKLLNLIRENLDSASVSGDDVTIHIERVDSQSYGMEVTITEHYAMSKTLFDKFIKE